MTYPRTQRFNQTSNPANHPSLAGMPSIIPGGKLMPTPVVDPAAEKRLSMLEEESRRLRDVIEEKERAKRRDLREWEVGEREAREANFRGELAEESLERLERDGEEGEGGAAF